MNKGLKWLKTRYRQDYLTWPNLADALDDWDSGASRFRPSSKTKMRSNFRSGFRAFLRDTIGDASIAYAILRYGYSTPEALLALVREVFEARRCKRIATESQPSVVTKKSHPDLAAAAKNARREYVAGQRLAYSVEDQTRKYDTLNWWEQDLHQRFHSGRLEREMIAANKAFGHGAGVEKSLSIEQLATLELSLRRL